MRVFMDVCLKKKRRSTIRWKIWKKKAVYIFDAVVQLPSQTSVITK